MKKKIGITTFHNSNNYGAVLQVFALQNTCEKLGYDVEIVNYVKNNIKTNSPIKNVINNIKHKKMKNALKELIFLPYNYIKFNRIKRFRKKYLKINKKEFYDSAVFEKQIADMDYLITGSDQVWNMQILNGYDKVFFLETEKKLKKISYAASSGGYEFTDTEKIIVGEQLKNYHKVSVREESMQKLIEECSQKEVEVVLDPTLLITEQSWTSLLKSKKISKNEKKYILVYTVENNENVVKIANALAKLTGFKIVYFTKFGKFINKYKSINYAGIEDFIFYFKNAEYVVTNSFHGTVFSILFNKKFWVINHSKRGNRIYDLLTKIDCTDRICCNENELNINKNIDYVNVNKKIEIYREKSIEFLKNALN